MKKIQLALLLLLVSVSYGFAASGDSLAGLPAVFVQNDGQLADFNENPRNEFLFYLKSEKLDIYFRKSGISYIFKKGKDMPDIASLPIENQVEAMKTFLQDSTLFYRLDIDFANANPNAQVNGSGSSDFVTNYYYAHCPNGIMNVHSFERIVYSNIYEGIDLVFYINQGKFKYDIVVKPGAKISEIQFAFNGADNIKLVQNEVVINSPVGIITETLPRSYVLNSAGTESETMVHYSLQGNTVAFKSEYDAQQMLVIDPEISWTTYYDDCFWNGSGSSIDVKGNQVVITSYGFSNNFPILNPGGSAYYQTATAGSGDYRILKFDSNGVRIWATYYGGTGYDHSPRVKIDYAGNIIVAGHTESTNIPTQNAGGYYDNTYNAGTYGGGTFIIKFNSSGVRQWGTYYDYVAYPRLEVDLNNNLYVLGRAEYDNPPVLSLAGAYNQATTSMDASGTSHSMDIFIVKFNSSTTRLWATNLGSTSDEILQDVRCGSDNYLNILAYGDNYYGNGIITQNPGSGAHYDNTLGIGTGGSSTDRDDALVYRFSPAGALFWGTAFSGTLNENMQQGRMTTDASNNIYIYGETRSTDLPVTNPGGGAYYDGTYNVTGGTTFDPFIARFSSTGVLNWCTYFGTYGLGYGMNFSSYLGVNSDNHLILVATEGGGAPGTFPVVPRTGDYNAVLSVYSGVYIAEFNSNLGIDWSTYYAGTTDRHTLGDCALSSNACGYQLYMTTRWEKYNAAAIDPPWVKPIPSSYQNTVFFTTGNESGLITRFGTLSVNADITPVGPFCANDGSVTLSAVTSGGTWSGVGVDPVTGVFDPAAAGAGTIEIIYTIAGPCGADDTINIVVNAAADATISPAGPFCITDAATTLTAADAGGTWSGNGVNPGTGLFDPAIAGLGTHEIIYSISGACGDDDTLYIVVSDALDATISPAGPFCITDAATTLSAVDAGGTWSGNGVNPGTGLFDPAIAGIGIHEIIYTISGNCGDDDTIQITVVSQMDASITAAGPFCDNDSIIVLSAAMPGGTWSGAGIVNPTTGTFNPANAGTGSTQIIYTIAGACGDDDTIQISIYPAQILSSMGTPESCITGLDASIDLSVSGGNSPYTYLWSNAANTQDLAGIGDGTYSVLVTDANGCQERETVVITESAVVCDDIIPHAVVPDIFSPNGDGQNDVLYVRGEGISQLSFVIYDRWGEKIFESSDPNTGWDGTFRGKPLDAAVFVYYLRVIFVNAEELVQEGNVTLVR